MTNSELMLAAITNGDEDNATVSAGLDALREANNDNLLGAVLTLAAAYKAAQDSRDMKAALAELSPASPIRRALRRAIVNECVELPPGADSMVVVVDGDRFPASSRAHREMPAEPPNYFIVSVGALWVNRVALRLHLERQQRRAAIARRRSR